MTRGLGVHGTALRWIAVAMLAASAPACLFPSYHVLTPAQLAELGTYRYPHVTREAATDACATALATLGYAVTVKDPSSGVVKTAPKMMSTTSSGTTTAAAVVEDSLAWNVSVEQSGDDAVIRATPRGYRNGTEMHGDNMWVAENMDDKFKDLWSEVDASMGMTTTPHAK